MKNIFTLIVIVMASVLVLTACSFGIPTTPDTPEVPLSRKESVSPTAVIEKPAWTGESEMDDSTPDSPTLDFPDNLPSGARFEFKTDFFKHNVPYEEIITVLSRDTIPAIDNPKFISVNEANEWLKPKEPVVIIELGDIAKAYPIQILMWHEIVNDVVGKTPLSVTFCPLCNTAIAFERDFKGEILDFGTTGRLRYSNLVMYDSQTHTWWQQATGEGLAGEHSGEFLTFYPAQIISWSEFMEAHPDGDVLSIDTGFSRDYGVNPYTGYDSVDNSPFLYYGPETPGVLPPVARVLTVELEGEAVAYPYKVLSEVNVINDTIANLPVAVFWKGGTVSALNTIVIANGRDVGSANAFNRTLEGRTLSFYYDLDSIKDQETHSSWNLLGEAVDGELIGKRLNPVIAVNHFWFSWSAFKPETRVFLP